MFNHIRLRGRGVPSRLSAVGLGFAVCLLAGCGTLDVPRAQNYPLSDQKKARTVHHWDVLADDVAARVSRQLPASGYAGAPLYVAPSTDTVFNQGFRNLLITRLVERGLPVSMQPSALQLAFETQIVQHGERLHNGSPAPLTTLAAGVSVLRDLHVYEHSAASGIASVVALGAMADGVTRARQGSASGGPTSTELLVSTSLHSGERYLARTADVYYIEGSEASLYMPAPAPLPPPAPTPLKTWKVVGQ